MKSSIVAACALSVSLVLAGCGATSTGSGGSSPAPSSSSASPTSASPRTTTGTSTTAKPAPAITTIPDDELPQIDGITYVDTGAGDDALLAELGKGTPDDGTRDDPEMVGIVLRGMKIGDQNVGLITMTRASRPFRGDEASDQAIDVAAGFAGALRADKKRVAGEIVWQSTRPGTPEIVSMAWGYDDAIYLVSSASSEDCAALMEELIAAVAG